MPISVDGMRMGAKISLTNKQHVVASATSEATCCAGAMRRRSLVRCSSSQFSIPLFFTGPSDTGSQLLRVLDSISVLFCFLFLFTSRSVSLDAIHTIMWSLASVCARLRTLRVKNRCVAHRLTSTHGARSLVAHAIWLFQFF